MGSELIEVREVRPEEEDEEEEGGEEKKLLLLDLLGSAYVVHLQWLRSWKVSRRVLKRRGMADGGRRGGIIAAVGLVALQHTSVLTAICSRVLNGVMFSHGVSRCFLIVRRYGFSLFILQGILVGFGDFLSGIYVHKAY